MHFLIVFILSFVIYFSADAQVTPIYFYGNQLTQDKDKATAYAVFGKLSTDSVYTFKMYDLYDNLLQTGFYKDDSLKIPHGRFSKYESIEDFNYNHDAYFYIKNKDRFLSEQGEFVDGKKVGRWIQFYPDGKIFSITNYLAGFKHGEFKAYSRKGKLISGGYFKLGLKDGLWIYEFGKKERYNNGVLY